MNFFEVGVKGGLELLVGREKPRDRTVDGEVVPTGSTWLSPVRRADPLQVHQR